MTYADGSIPEIGDVVRFAKYQRVPATVRAMNKVGPTLFIDIGEGKCWFSASMLKLVRRAAAGEGG